MAFSPGSHDSSCSKVNSFIDSTKEHHPDCPDGLQLACSKARIYKIIFGCTWEEMNSVRETGKVYILTRLISLSKLSIISL
jgi:hypothetical protein